MITDPLRLHALELLERGHQLYPPDHAVAAVGYPPERLIHDSERLIRAAAGAGPAGAARWIRRTAAGLRAAVATDSGLDGVLGRAHRDQRLGWQATRVVLAEARNDSMPMADTALGRREAMRRTAARLRAQHRQVLRSRRQAALLARRMRRLSYSREPPHGIAVDVVRYDPAVAAGRTAHHIAAALDRLGITDPVARRNWMRGYRTLITRESGGRPWAVAPEATGFGHARGLTQTIPATFALYHQPGTSTNIYDPVANICASMNYVMGRYGVGADGANLAALVQQADPRRSPKGY